ncbi:MAG: hypothetical protein U0Y10_03465 [Spirosomataceae bacterium]
MDDGCYIYLQKLALPNVVLLSQETFLGDDAPLQAAKLNRSKIEFYFTCSPSMPLYVLNHFPEVSQITYLDADLFFFSDVTPIFEEIGTKSVAIIPHRFAWHGKYFEKYGKYNVGWVTFRRDEQGLECLTTWRNECLDWCFDHFEDGKFADQKYLDTWPDNYSNLHIIQNLGANVASWNVGRFRVREKNEQVLINGTPLIFYHFTHLKEIKPWLYKTELSKYFTWSTATIRRKIYGVYIDHLNKFAVVDKKPKRGRKEFRFRNLGYWIQRFTHLARLLVFPDYLILINKKVV